MCGIAGFTHRNHAPVSSRIREATDAIVHRGPDQQGIYESKYISLGAVRLKIIDLLGGAQPMCSDDRNTVVAFNGEIYNHADLRRQLEAAGHRFHSRSDTEVILRGFLEWDRGLLTRLRGMFAIAVWSEREKRLLLARDPLGIKPIYIYRRGQDLYFGSELKTIFAHPEVERRLDHTGLGFYLSLNYVPGPLTLVRKIQKLPPGHYLEWQDGRVEGGSYWKLDFSAPRKWPFAEAKEKLDSLLRDSVREHLAADVPLGVWLSGGIDSTTILHYAVEVCGARPKTFSISFRGRNFDEARYCREVAARYGTDHYELDLNPTLDFERAISESAYYSDEPSADAGALPVWFLSALTRQHATVALSGEGADELFGGYLTYQADLLAVLARKLPQRTLRAVSRLLRRWPVSDEKISFEYKLKRFLEGACLPPDDAHTFWNGTFSESQKREFLRAELGPPVAALFNGFLPQAATGDHLNRYLAFDQHYFLPDDILYKADRMSMAHSLEVRPPFLDHRIVEFAATLPVAFKMKGSRQKVLLRSLMEDKLPPGVLRRPKIGLDIPAHDWLRGPLRSLLLDTLTTEALEQTGLFYPEKIRSLIDAHLQRRANLGYHLWGLLILFLWMKRWNIQSAPAAEEMAERRPEDAALISSYS